MKNSRKSVNELQERLKKKKVSRDAFLEALELARRFQPEPGKSKNITPILWESTGTNSVAY